MFGDIGEMPQARNHSCNRTHMGHQVWHIGGPGRKATVGDVDGGASAEPRSKAEALMRPLCCLEGLPQPHWVPDTLGQSCSGCGNTFSLWLRRHHCRCCGAVFCETCSAGRTSAPGWGFDRPVRVCDECHALESHHLPILLAGDLFAKPAAAWSGFRGGANDKYLKLSYDQSALLWAPWRHDEGADDSQERSALISQLMCASSAKGSRTMVRVPAPRLEHSAVSTRAEPHAYAHAS